MGRRVCWSEKKILDYIAAGRGQGEGANYVPWLQVGDFSSSGRCHRIADHRNGRIHHCFSDLEADYYHILAWSDAVIDIREQFPLLPRTDTERIADELGFAHPKAPGNKINEVMTTDFVITACNGSESHLEARYVKYESDLRNDRVCEKLEIERRFWEQAGVPFKVVTETGLNRIKARNIQKLLAYYDPASLPNEIQTAEGVDMLVESLVQRRYERLSNCTTLLDSQIGCEQGGFLALFYYLGAQKKIPLMIDRQTLTPTKAVDQIVDIAALQRQLAAGTPIIDTGRDRHVG